MSSYIEQLLEAERKKQQALFTFNPDEYDEAVQSQLKLTEADPQGLRRAPIEKLQELRRLISINAALVMNLQSISPWVVLALNGYSRSGSPVEMSTTRFRARS